MVANNSDSDTHVTKTPLLSSLVPIFEKLAYGVVGASALTYVAISPMFSGVTDANREDNVRSRPAFMKETDTEYYARNTGFVAFLLGGLLTLKRRERTVAAPSSPRQG